MKRQPKKESAEEAFNSKYANKVFSKYYSNIYILLIIPLLLLLVSFFTITQAIENDGTAIYRDISLKGGLSLTLSADEFLQYSAQEMEQFLIEAFPQETINVKEFQIQGQKGGFIIDTSLEENKLIEKLEELENTNLEMPDDFTANFIAPSLSQAFFTQAINTLIISFILISAIIFIAFRKIVPSLAIIISIIFDIVVTIGILNLFGIQVSIAGIGALLMLIGYSIDTDILLTNRVLKETREPKMSYAQHFQEKFQDSFKTGMLMAGTTLSAALVALIFTNSQVIFEIVLILIIGLIVDMISTWIQNAAMLKWWMSSKK